MSSQNLLFRNGVLTPTTGNLPVSIFLESRPGAYTTTRTHDNASRILFWERHVKGLINSINTLFKNAPRLLFQPSNITPVSVSSSLPVIQPAVWDAVINSSVKDSLDKAFLIGSKQRRNVKNWQSQRLSVAIFFNLNDGGGEINEEENVLKAFDVYVHIGVCAPTVFGALVNKAQLALVGEVEILRLLSILIRLRKSLQKLKHPSTTELLLSNDGNRIPEGSVSNFFVVHLKDEHKGQESRGSYPYEVQTAPVGDGVLPGVIRQLIIEVCGHLGIPIQEKAPLWSEHETWQEAFITSRLGIMQDVKTILVPSTWESWEEVSWEEKHSGRTGHYH